MGSVKLGVFTTHIVEVEWRDIESMEHACAFFAWQRMDGESLYLQVGREAPPTIRHSRTGAESQAHTSTVREGGS